VHENKSHLIVQFDHHLIKEVLFGVNPNIVFGIPTRIVTLVQIMPAFDTEDLKPHLRKNIGDRFYGNPILVLSYDHVSLVQYIGSRSSICENALSS